MKVVTDRKVKHTSLPFFGFIHQYISSGLGKRCTVWDTVHFVGVLYGA